MGGSPPIHNSLSDFLLLLVILILISEEAEGTSGGWLMGEPPAPDGLDRESHGHSSLSNLRARRATWRDALQKSDFSGTSNAQLRFKANRDR
jgi:hypothetical protein